MTHPLSAPRSNHPVPLATSIVLNQLANLYLLFAINEGLVLRSSTNIKTWKTLLVGLLIADVGHLWSVRALGTEVYWYLPSWNAMTAGNVGFVYVVRFGYLYLVSQTLIVTLCR